MEYSVVGTDDDPGRCREAAAASTPASPSSRAAAGELRDREPEALVDLLVDLLQDGREDDIAVLAVRVEPAS